MRCFPKNVYLYKAKQHLLKYRLSSPHPVKSTIINNNWAYRQNTVPICGFTPHGTPCWGQSSSQIGGSGNSFLHYGHGHGMGLIKQRHCRNRRPTCSQMADQLLLPAWEVSVGSGLWVRSEKCRLCREGQPALATIACGIHLCSEAPGQESLEIY